MIKNGRRTRRGSSGAISRHVVQIDTDSNFSQVRLSTDSVANHLELLVVDKLAENSGYVGSVIGGVPREDVVFLKDSEIGVV